MELANFSDLPWTLFLAKYGTPLIITIQSKVRYRAAGQSENSREPVRDVDPLPTHTTSI